MSTVTLFFLEGMAIGAVIAAAILCMLWWADIRDRDRKESKTKREAYQEGYAQGNRMKLRQMAHAERVVEVLRADLEEIRDAQRRGW